MRPFGNITELSGNSGMVSSKFCTLAVLQNLEQALVHAFETAITHDDDMIAAAHIVLEPSEHGVGIVHAKEFCFRRFADGIEIELGGCAFVPEHGISGVH